MEKIKISDVREWLVVITTLLTILGIFVKVINNLFLDLIKLNFKFIPAKQELFDTILKSIVYIAFVIEIIVVFTLLISNLFKKNNTGGSSSFIAEIIAQIILFLLIYLVLSTAIVVSYLGERLMQIFIQKNKSEKIYKGLLGKVKKCINREVSKEVLGRIRKYLSRKINRIIFINKVLSIIFTAIIIIFICIYAKDVNNNKSILITLISMGVLTFSLFIILNSITPTLEVIKGKYIYYINTKAESNIVCRFFLEYNEFYLLNYCGYLTWIKKQEVTAIKKILIEDHYKNYI